MKLTAPSARPDDQNATRRPRVLAARAAAISWLAGVAFLVLLTLLHLIRSDVSPDWQTTSEYARGDLGWLMVVAFALSAVGCGALAVAIVARSGRMLARIGAVVLAIACVGTAVGGAFVADPISTPQDRLSASGTLHGIGAGLALVLLPVAALLIGIGLARDSAFRSARRPLWWSTAFPLAALVAFMVAQALLLGAGDGDFGPDVPVGWPERALVLAYAAWQIGVARVVSRHTRR